MRSPSLIEPVDNVEIGHFSVKILAALWKSRYVSDTVAVRVRAVSPLDGLPYPLLRVNYDVTLPFGLLLGHWVNASGKMDCSGPLCRCRK